MRGPYHEFLLVERSRHEPADYLALIHHAHAIKVPDDLVRYIADSLDWIESSNPAGGSKGSGLNYYGPTIVESSGAQRLAGLLQAWAALFRLGPEELELTGYWSPSSGKYERLLFNRDKVVILFDQVAHLAARVTSTSYLLHLGI